MVIHSFASTKHITHNISLSFYDFLKCTKHRRRKLHYNCIPSDSLYIFPSIKLYKHILNISKERSMNVKDISRKKVAYKLLCIVKPWVNLYWKKEQELNLWFFIYCVVFKGNQDIFRNVIIGSRSLNIKQIPMIFPFINQWKR